MAEKMIPPCDFKIRFPTKNGQPLPACTDGERVYFSHLGSVCALHKPLAVEVEAVYESASEPPSPLTPKE